jgi:hypothetical protein
MRQSVFCIRVMLNRPRPSFFKSLHITVHGPRGADAFLSDEVDDREVLCLAVLQELLGFESDHGFYQWLESNAVIRKLFPRWLTRPNWADRRALFPLSDEAARNLIQRRQKADEILDLVIRDPGVLEAIRGALAERGAAGRESSSGNEWPHDVAIEGRGSQGLFGANVAADLASPATCPGNPPFDSRCEKRLATQGLPRG